MNCLVICVLWLQCLTITIAQTIDGCPMYGCRPSGTFSFSLDVPKQNASIGWVSQFFLGPVPDYGGCVVNPSILVCQSNGPGPADTGYVAIDITTGDIRWRDPVLRFPTLPVLDADGGLWGSDGSNLMSYDADGKPMTSNIPLNPNMRPIFGTQYVGTGIVLVVSEGGEIATWLPDGTPLASVYLKDTVQRYNGTFLPVAPPVVNNNRVYVLTEFAPDDIAEASSVLGLQRLYAIDIHESMTDRLTIAWYANFEKETSKSYGQDTLKFIPSTFAERLKTVRLDPFTIKPSILLDKAINTIYISLPPPMLLHAVEYDSDIDLGENSLFAIKDTGNDSALVFKTSHSATGMALYESNLATTVDPPSNAADQLWITLADCKILAIEKLGNISKVIDLANILKTNCTVTSKMTTARARDADEDFLVFGINVQQPTNTFLEVAAKFGINLNKETSKNYVIGIDTPENHDNNGMPVSFLIPTPEDTKVFGQIIGVKTIDNERKNQLIVFSQTDEKAAKIFTIS